MTRPSLHTLTMGESGTRVVFLHGLFGQGRNWTTIGKALADRHRVLLVDLPHHGRSPSSERFDYLDVADHVAELVEAQGSEDDPAAVVGHSMGGKVAMLLALTHPSLVERLVVADMSPVAYPTARDFVTYTSALQSLDLDAVTRREDADRLLEPAVPDPTIRGFLLQNLRRHGDSWRWQLNLDVLARGLAEIGGWPEDRLAGTPPYDGPVLWLAGERSGYVKDEYADAMRRWFPHYRKVTIKGAGHWLHSERPDVFTAALRQFLGD
ncbi:alpha/beta fold hydrolase [Nocardioides cheoyonin]|uniref:alpha/beta fold hydrolase n=1 Tax=Nocardioides cheoyonin TaxID=3156615 RepID=UPI0032B513A3